MEEPSPHRHYFPTTRWTMIGRAGDGDPAASRAALDQLLRIYEPALRVHLVATKHIEPHLADDLLQGFITAKFVEVNLASHADRSKGKFRTLLLTCLDRFIASEFRKDRAGVRGGGRVASLDVAATEIADSNSQSPSQPFETEWVRDLLRETARRMQAECEETHRPEIWGIFEERVLRPTLEDVPPADYQDLVQRFGLRSPVQASNTLMTAKRMFQRLLREAVAEYASTEEEIDEEIRDLHTVLSRGGLSPR